MQGEQLPLTGEQERVFLLTSPLIGSPLIGLANDTDGWPTIRPEQVIEIGNRTLQKEKHRYTRTELIADSAFDDYSESTRDNRTPIAKMAPTNAAPIHTDALP
jgi:hypothetical protein